MIRLRLSCLPDPGLPNDNPFVVSLFGTIKMAPEYPGRFLDRVELNSLAVGPLV